MVTGEGHLSQPLIHASQLHYIPFKASDRGYAKAAALTEHMQMRYPLSLALKGCNGNSLHVFKVN